MWTGTCERLCAVDCLAATEWIAAIPFSEWPQQHPVDGQLRPAMQNDPLWHGFGAIAAGLLGQLELWRFKTDNKMLSVVMPGHDIHAHKDLFDARWEYRVHVPLLTNLAAKFVIDGIEFQMAVGAAYLVNVSKQHSVYNKGCVPRIHFMFDCYL